ncbi:MAG: hypothetical protein EDM74_12220 [Armatimonadetes bacterium]|nr:MAG: hypothetical protein EDM74_12220 [Armatimonadota bacterium]
MGDVDLPSFSPPFRWLGHVFGVFEVSVQVIPFDLDLVEQKVEGLMIVLTSGVLFKVLPNLLPTHPQPLKAILTDFP